MVPVRRVRVGRGFVAAAPNRCWVADFTHVATWASVVHVVFGVDPFSRRIVGWSAARSRETRLVRDALEMTLWQHDRDEYPRARGELMHHSDAARQYTGQAGRPPGRGRHRGLDRICR
ncbi:DDE-type integrase/transposase/recombinase [Streptomyces mutabilis]|uniref:DDE-type integrase/transposase/recombinase n=1 Tax=Streptomyces mutabilis TaxID=67332 RepID=UPI0036625537